MKDQLLFEHVLAELLRCRDDDLDERDQRESILSEIVQLTIDRDQQEREKDQVHDTAVARIRRLEAIKQAARNLLGAADDPTWRRFKQTLIEAIEADTTLGTNS